MTNDNRAYIKKSHDNQIESLCAAAAIFILSPINCSPIYKGFESLQGNDNLKAIYRKLFNMKLTLAKYKDNSYYKVLSKTQSGRANRKKLAFDLTDSSMDSQIYPIKSDNTHERLTRQWGSTPFFMAADLCMPTLYEGKTSLNKIAFGRISGAVALCAESDSSHPIFAYSVIPTQKHKGVIHHG